MINAGCMLVALSSRMCWRISTVNLFALIWPSLYTKNRWLYLPFLPKHTLTVQGLSPGLWLLPTIINLHPHFLLLEPGRVALSKLCKSPLILLYRWHFMYKLTLERPFFCLYEAHVNWKPILIAIWSDQACNSSTKLNSPFVTNLSG